TAGTLNSKTQQAFAGNSIVANIGNGGYQANNSEVISILMDLDKFPNGTDTINTNHAKNPQKTAFLTAKMATDTTRPGVVGSDYVYRDPWGNPYIISMDMDGDNKTKDAFYCRTAVSTVGVNGLVNPTGAADSYIANATVMVWSMGPDRTCDFTVDGK